MHSFTRLLNPRLCALACGLGVASVGSAAHAVRSGELYTSKGYQYGRFEARVQFAFGDGVVSSFFLWKDGSEQASIFWNELDFEKLGPICEIETNALYGLPESSHNEAHTGLGDLCGQYHTYTYEWTPEYIAWLVDGVEIRRETGETAAAFAENTAEGMQLRFNVWPGDSTFGGNFDPAILPVHQYINWVQYSAYVNGAFELQWREDFTATTRPSGWSTGNWDSPKGLSTHTPSNIAFMDGYAVISLTADDATGFTGTVPPDTTDTPPPAPEGSEPVPSATTPAPTVPPTEPGATAPAPSTTGTPMAEDDADEGGGCHTARGAARGVSLLPLLLALGLGLVRRRVRV